MGILLCLESSSLQIVCGGCLLLKNWGTSPSISDPIHPKRGNKILVLWTKFYSQFIPSLLCDLTSKTAGFEGTMEYTMHQTFPLTVPPGIKGKCCNGNFLWCFFWKKWYNKITGYFASCDLCLRSELSLKPGLKTYSSIGTGNCCSAVCFQIYEIQTGKKCFITFVNEISAGENPSPRSMNLIGFCMMEFA